MQKIYPLIICVSLVAFTLCACRQTADTKQPTETTQIKATVTTDPPTTSAQAANTHTTTVAASAFAEEQSKSPFPTDIQEAFCVAAEPNLYYPSADPLFTDIDLSAIKELRQSADREKWCITDLRLQQLPKKVVVLKSKSSVTVLYLVGETGNDAEIQVASLPADAETDLIFDRGLSRETYQVSAGLFTAFTQLCK